MPKAFISYSWDDQAHKDWVRKLATRLRGDGVETTLDQWHAGPGDQLPAFMDKAIRENEFVLIICTPGYKSKSEGAAGGVGFEGHIIQGHVFASNNHAKFIPILRKGEWNTDAWSALLGKYWIDLREGANYERNYQELLLTLRGQRETAPPVGGGRKVYLEEEPSGVIVPRSGYIETLRAALVPKPGMFLLTGEPGSGKSTLALMFAREIQPEFEAVVFQRCGQRSPETMVSELADTLKEELGNEVVTLPPEEKLKAIKKWLRQRRALLVLDDVWPADGLESIKSQGLPFRDMLPGGPVSVLFTSRPHHLPWLKAAQIQEVASFTREEAEAVFRECLGDETFTRHHEALMQFAQRMESLPLAVSAGAEFLRNEFGPLDQAARGLRLAQLRNEIHDVPGLLQLAIESQGPEESRLLLAASVCSQEGFWLPLVLSIAGLNSTAGGLARNHLVNARLLRVLEQDRQRFGLHALLREQLHTDPAMDEFRRKHAEEVEKLFEQWETRWRECRECLPEVLQASEFLWNENRSRHAKLSFWGYACAKRIGELAMALQIEQQNEQRWSSVVGKEGKDGLQRSYGNQALILTDWGQLEEAVDLHKKEEAICEELGDKNGLQASYGNQAGVLLRWERYEEALTLYKKQETICEELGSKDSLQRSYGGQALILRRRGHLEEALALHKKEQAICEELGNKNDLRRSYGNQALVLREWGRLEEALALHKKEEAICLELGNKPDLGYCYWSWGVLARDMKDKAISRAKLEAALAIFTELKMPRERDAVQAELDEGQGEATLG